MKHFLKLSALCAVVAFSAPVSAMQKTEATPKPVAPTTEAAKVVEPGCFKRACTYVATSKVGTGCSWVKNNKAKTAKVSAAVITIGAGFAAANYFANKFGFRNIALMADAGVAGVSLISFVGYKLFNKEARTARTTAAVKKAADKLKTATELVAKLDADLKAAQDAFDAIEEGKDAAEKATLEKTQAALKKAQAALAKLQPKKVEEKKEAPKAADPKVEAPKAEKTAATTAEPKKN
ncbi:MAG: VmcA [candidate division TM6 bacterium GW2011_GWE2_41_16]|nr:MAG: VmcA [candidate division TM6 bacterium GW2011_GWE2_41_16]